MLPASRLCADVATLQPGPEGTDAFVAQMNGGMNFGSNAALASGQGPDFAGGEKRAFLQFSLTSIPAGATINSATLSLYVSQAAGGAQTASAYKVTSTWDESAVNWNNQPSSDTTVISSVAVNSTGWKNWTITSLVSSWCNGTVTNNGVLVKQSSGSPPNNVQLYSSDYGGDATLRPKLVVDYTSVNNPPTAVSLNAPTNVTDTTISLSWSQNADADFQSYKLYRSTTPGVTEGSTLISSIQNPASTAFTDTGLTATTAVFYRVFVNDTGALSSGSNEVSATTASPPPPPPSVANLSVSATPTSIVADGAAQSTRTRESAITATLTDVNNQPVADHVVNFTTTAGTLSAASATSNAQGNATVTLTSGTTAGTANIVSTSSGLTGTCSVTFTAPPPSPATISVAVTPTLITADGVTTGTVSSNVTVDGQQPAPDGTPVTFTTTWGTLQGADPATPQSLQATTVNGVATVVLLSSNTMPTGTSTFTVTASALGAQGQGTATAQTEESYSDRIVLKWLQPTCNIAPPCVRHGEKMSGGGAIHFYWIVPPGSAPIPNQPGALMGFTSFRAYEVAHHVNQEKVWLYLPNDLLLNQINCTTYTDPAQLPACAPAIAQGETLLDFYTHLAPGWGTDDFHNGKWVVEAHYWEQATPISPVENKTESIHIYLNNLLVQVTEDELHPRLLQWRGAGLANKTEVKFKLTCEGEVIISPQVRLYDLSRTDPAGNDAIRTVTLGAQVVTAGGATWTWPWDGQKESATPNQLIPAQPGVYAFEVLADWTGPTCGGEDRKSSRCLSIEETSTSVPSFRPWLNETIDFRYRLNQLAFPGSVKIKVYELTTMTVVRTLENLPYVPGVTHTVTWDGKDESGQTIVAEPDRYAWSLEAQDDCANLEKGHRQKWALEKGGTFAIPLYLGEIESGTASPSSTVQILSTSGSSGSPGGYMVLPISGPAVAHFSSKDRIGHGYKGQFKIYSPEYSSFNANINPSVKTPIRIIPLESPGSGGGVSSGSVALVNGGLTSVEWDGKDSNGNMMLAGLYPVVVEIDHASGDPEAHGGSTSFAESIKLQNVSNPRSDPFRPWSTDATYNSFRVKYDLSITPASSSTVHGKTFFKIFDSEFNEVPGRLLLDESVSSPQTFPDEVTLTASERGWLLPPDRYYWVVTGINGARQNCIPAMGTFTLLPEVRVRSIEFTSDHQIDETHNLLVDNDADWSSGNDQHIQPPEYERPIPADDEDLSLDTNPTKNFPITQTRDTEIKAKVSLAVRPSALKQQTSLLRGKEAPLWWWEGYFPPMQGILGPDYAGPLMTVGVTSNEKLPNMICRDKGPLYWEWLAYLPFRQGGPPTECIVIPSGRSGEHEVFVTWGTPITNVDQPNPSGNVQQHPFPGYAIEPIDNQLTTKRIRIAVQVGSQAADPTDPDSIAVRLGHYIGTEANIAFDAPLLSAGVQTTDWDLLAGSPKWGNCVQTAILHDRMLRLLGIMAEYRSVYPRLDGATDALHVETRCIHDDTGDNINDHERLWLRIRRLSVPLFELHPRQGCCVIDSDDGGVYYTNYPFETRFASSPTESGDMLVLKYLLKDRPLDFYASVLYWAVGLGETRSDTDTRSPPECPREGIPSPDDWEPDP